MKRFLSFSFISALFFVVASCGPKPEEQVKDFALKFGDFVNTNQKDSIQKYYPDYELTDSLNSVPVGNIIVEKGENDISYIVKYSPVISLNVSLSTEGKPFIDQSKGLIVIDHKGLNLIKEANLWNVDLMDTDLKHLVAEQLRQDSISKKQEALAALPTFTLIRNGNYANWFREKGYDVKIKKELDFYDDYIQTVTATYGPKGDIFCKFEGTDLGNFEITIEGAPQQLNQLYQEAKNWAAKQNNATGNPDSNFFGAEKTGNKVRVWVYIN